MFPRSDSSYSPPQPLAILGAPNSSFLHLSYMPSYSAAGGCRVPSTRTTSFLAADGVRTAAQSYFARMNTAAPILAGTAPVKLSFFWLCNGNSNGYREVYYSTDGGNTWNILTSSVTNTPQLVDRSAQWNADTITLPITRPASVLIGFRFVNNANADEDPPLAVDAIRIFEDVPVTGPTLTRQPLVPWVCSGDGFTVSFTTSGTFGANNTFSVQLSDATGSFANPSVIGSGGGTPIPCVMPATTPPGNYKIRVVAYDPAGTVSNKQPISVANLSGLSCSVSPVPVPAG
jgi:hypothetical protein